MAFEHFCDVCCIRDHGFGFTRSKMKTLRLRDLCGVISFSSIFEHFWGDIWMSEEDSTHLRTFTTLYRLPFGAFLHSHLPSNFTNCCSHRPFQLVKCVVPLALTVWELLLITTSGRRRNAAVKRLRYSRTPSICDSNICVLSLKLSLTG